jgi:hypothetical protein
MTGGLNGHVQEISVTAKIDYAVSTDTWKF